MLFQLAPFLVIVPIFLPFVTLPFTRELVVRNLELGVLYLMAVPLLSALGYFLAGWASDNKYALLGAVRYVAVLVSYELPMLIGVLGVVMVTGTLNLVEIVEQQRVWPLLFAQLPAFLLFLIGGMAEGNRTPFDIAIAESEIVGGPVRRIQRHALVALLLGRVRSDLQHCPGDHPALSRRLARSPPASARLGC
ncbi:MAG: hypothetical protein KatS3mg061_2723 [Dehalococcoidia bacterium]|nr:MAG: hypothetical protein KatS3mg061_2723 [Dehalococcoidia bacterium]